MIQAACTFHFHAPVRDTHHGLNVLQILKAPGQNHFALKIMIVILSI